MNQTEHNWIDIINKIYDIEAESLQEIRTSFLKESSQMVHFRTEDGDSWARYIPSSRELIGHNNHVIACAAEDDEFWWGEAFAHQNQGDTKGDWVCVDGVLKNRLGSTMVVHGIVPTSILIPFLQWQPTAAMYERRGGDYMRMMEMFREELGLEDEDWS